MKKLFNLILFMVGVMCAFALPPPEIQGFNFQNQIPAESDVVYRQHTTLDMVTREGYRVPENITISVDELLGYKLLASLGDGLYSPPENTGTVEEAPAGTSFFTLEYIIGAVLLIFTTLFGGLWSKGIGKLTEAKNLLEKFLEYIENGNLSKEELADLKARIRKLLNKTG